MKKAKKKQSGLHFLFPTFIKSIPHHKRVFRTASRYTLHICIWSFLLFNILFSQAVSPFYFQMANDSQDAAVYYLQSIRPLPQFSSELARLKNVYGTRLENSVFVKETEEKILIQNYEQMLQKNPYARDILLSLFSIYNKIGNKELALEYLGRAKNIDPLLK